MLTFKKAAILMAAAVVMFMCSCVKDDTISETAVTIESSTSLAETAVTSESITSLAETSATEVSFDGQIFNDIIQSALDNEVIPNAPHIDLTEFQFGCSETEIRSKIDSEPYSAEPYYTSYMACSDNFTASPVYKFMFNCNYSGFYTLYIITPVFNDEALEYMLSVTLADLNRIYGFTEDSWEKSGEFRYYNSYSDDKTDTNLSISIYTYDEGSQITISLFNLNVKEPVYILPQS